MRKICVVTGTRAEYGLLSRLMRLIDESEDCQLQVVATNMHLLPEYGNTYQEIEKDGFRIDAKVLMRKTTDDAYGVIASMAEEMNGMNEALRELCPDMVVILGDRYEMLVVATVAMLQRIPIAHLHGGEISEGAMDDSIRHSITKMSSLHFTSTEEYRRRVIQLGEQPERVFYVGAMGVENLKKVPLMRKLELEDSLNFKFEGLSVLVTYHPVTLGNRIPKDEISDLLKALDSFSSLKVLFTMPNSDQGGEEIRSAIEAYCVRNEERCRCFKSLGVRRYLSALGYVTAVVGNSSSGLLEVPSAHIPTLNIGDRQKGRLRTKSIIDCGIYREDIIRAINRAMSSDFRAQCKEIYPPYGDGHAAEKIAKKMIETIQSGKIDLKKKFYDL